MIGFDPEGVRRPSASRSATSGHAASRGLRGTRQLAPEARLKADQVLAFGSGRACETASKIDLRVRTEAESRGQDGAEVLVWETE